MKIKELRTKLGWSQTIMSEYLGIPKRTIENWETGVNTPPAYVEKLIINELERQLNPIKEPFAIHNITVKNYADICKSFSHDSSEWGSLSFEKFYTTDGSGWTESNDNAHGGIDVSWAFGMSDEAIDYTAAEQLFELLKEELQTAVDDGWDEEQLAAILNKFNL